MKALLLAGGFGTRLEAGSEQYAGHFKTQLQEWVAGKPKGLVVIHGRPLADYLLQQLQRAGIDASNVYVQTNARYHNQYTAWAASQAIPPENVFNNGVVSNETQLGPLGDLRFALDSGVGYDDNLLVVASDTLLYDDHGELFAFTSLVADAGEDSCGKIVVYHGEPERLSKHGIVSVDRAGFVNGFQEKPKQPRSDLVNASVHFYTKEMLQYFRSQKFTPADDWGKLIEQLYHWFPFKVVIAGRRVDIGTIEDVLRENGCL